MRRLMVMVAVLLAAAAVGLANPAARAQSSDTFNDTSTGPWWDSETANAGLTIAETNNRLEFSTQPSPNLAPQSFAGYVGKNWRVRATSEIRARVKWRSFPSGTTSTVGSEAGVVFSMFPAASARQSTGYRSGIHISIGTHTFGNNVGARRDFNVNYINPTGAVTNIYRFWAFFTNTPFTFYNYYSGNQVGTIQYEGTFYIQYIPELDVMYISLTGYNDPNAPAVTGATLGVRDPQVFAVGGYGTRPAGMTGANAWLDDFFLDMGMIEAPPSNVAAEDGINTSRVRVTWSAALNATGYRVLRREGAAAPIVLATLPTTSLSYDDITAVPGTTYTYIVRMITPSGDAFEASDTGWRGLAPPTGVVATDGSSTTAVSVSWNASTGAQQYAVFRALPPATATEIGTATASPFNDVYADAGLAYTYTVRARAPAGDSAPSSADTGWRNISPPADVYASDGTSTQSVSVTWSATAGATGFRVFRAQGTGATSEIGTTAASALSFDDTYAVTGTVYTYSVRARTAAGDSAASAPDTGWRNVAAPTGVAASDGTSTSAVNISWNAVAGVTQYAVFRALGAAAATEIGTSAASPFADTTATAGLSYTYTVRARTAAGDSAASAPDTGWRNFAAPTSVAASDGTSTSAVNVSWNAVAGVTQYAVFRALGAAAATEIGTSAASPFADTTATAGLSYTYTVRTRTAAGDSAASAPDTGWRNVAAPTGVAASDGTSTTAVNVSWNAVAGVTQYAVFRALGAAAATEIGTSAASPFADTTATAGLSYTYTVRARTAAGDSAASAPDTGWRNVAAPTGVAASDGTSTSAVNVSWNAVAGVTQYAVFRALGAAAATEIGTSAASPFADTTATAGLSYTYTVRARTAAGDSAASAPDTGWRNVAAPTGVAASDGTSTSGVNISWGAVTGATGYRVMRAAAGGAPSEVGTSNGTSLTDTRATAGVVYSYTVLARTAAGDSAMSSPDRGWRNVIAPRDLVASDGTSADGIELTWSSAAAGDGFNIYRTAGSDAPALIGTSRSTSYRDTTAVPMTTYSYVVRAKAGPGESAASDADRGWRSVAAPAAVNATDGTEREFVRVTWTPSTSPAVTGYRVLRRLPGGQLTQLDAVPASTVTINDKTIAPGVVGTYLVRCITARGDSAEGTSDTGFRPTSGGTGGDDGGGGGDGSGGGKGGGEGGIGKGLGSGDGWKTGERSDDKGQIGASDTSSDGSDAPDRGDLGKPMPADAALTPPTCDELVIRVRQLADASKTASDCEPLLSGDVPAACRMAAGDVNLDGRTDERDLAAFLVAWANSDVLRGDLNRDGRIDGVDLSLALAGGTSVGGPAPSSP